MLHAHHSLGDLMHVLTVLLLDFIRLLLLKPDINNQALRTASKTLIPVTAGISVEHVGTLTPVSQLIWYTLLTRTHNRPQG